MKTKLHTLLFAFLSIVCFAQKEVTFEVSDIPAEGSQYIGIRGNTTPLSWEKTIFLNKKDTNYAKVLKFDTGIESIEYKFVLDNGKDVQWEGIQNRNESIRTGNHFFKSKWNQEKFIDPSTLPKLPVKDLMEDFEVIRNTILKVHPGLYRYNDTVTVNKNLAVLKNSFQKPLTYAETFLAMSKFIATIQCDHTLVSAYNQEGIITSLIHRQKDKVPFAFKWIDNRMIITHNASDSDKIRKGSEVLSMNGIPSSDILEKLLPYITADGATVQNKITKAQVDGYLFRYNAFDVLYPLLFPLQNNEINLVIKNQDEQSTSELSLKSVTRKERNERLVKRYQDFPSTPEDLWKFEILENNIGYLKIGSFATDDFKTDWKFMLKDAFKEMKKKKVENLVLDIRENQGGLDDASYELEKYIYQKNVVTDGLESRSRFLEFPEEVKPHIQTWDYWFYNLKEDENYKKGIYYVFPRNRTKKSIKPSNTTFKGNIYMLTSANNVSGAFYLARLFKKSKGGILIGQETGGNQNGINGGAILFFKPPNSRININLPVMGSFSTEPLSNSGIIPDVIVDGTVEDLINNIDLELEKAIELINKN